MQLKEILQLNVKDRIHLVETIWDSIEKDTVGKLSKKQLQLLEDRISAYNEKPTKGSSVDSVIKRIQKQL
ncbi:MAG: putative addiction module component [Bacteroidota bacterium]|jgi:putative addiction module component (TIGR02574 family)